MKILRKILWLIAGIHWLLFLALYNGYVNFISALDITDILYNVEPAISIWTDICNYLVNYSIFVNLICAVLIIVLMVLQRKNQKAALKSDIVLLALFIIDCLLMKLF